MRVIGWGLSLVLLALLMVGSARAQAPAPNAGIFVTDAGNYRIVRIDDMTGAGWTTFGSTGSGVNQFNLPFGIFVDATGKIYVADSGNNRLVRFDDMTGAGWTTFGALGGGVNQFRRPVGVSVDGAGRIYVAEALNHQSDHIFHHACVWKIQGLGARVYVLVTKFLRFRNP